MWTPIKDTHIRRRDGLGLLNMAFFAKGLNPNAPYKNGPRKIDLLVSIGDYVVECGDLIVGNSDNVAIVPRGEIDAVLPALEGTAEKEKGLEAEIATGQTCMTLMYKALA